ncbi:YdcF family protein [Aquincola sp. MAHUQ-54]|uniref:YdcF family protein n=1 Tax=Aquincola agrisoli TaxID=3119538 RepID=A0AAW9QA36_9BURK
MNDLFLLLGIESWKAALNALVMPPAPFLLLSLAGLWLVRRRRTLGLWTLSIGLAASWLGMTVGAGEWLRQVGMPPAAAFGAAQVAQLRSEAAAGQPVAIIVLGAGRERYAPEYGQPNLRPLTMERLRYGVWLGRQTGAPVGFTGGVGHGSMPGPSEGDIAERIAAQEFGLPLRWVEKRSRDTRENGRFMVEQLQRDGIRKAVLVTHDMHMPRSLRAFREAAAQAGMALEVVPAPAGLASRGEPDFTRWMPSTEGVTVNRYFWHEKLGWWAGA